MPEVFGALPHPKVLVMGFGDQIDRVAEQIRTVAPTVRPVRELNEVRQAEWDFLVTNQDVSARTAKHISVLVEEGNALGVPEDREGMKDPGNRLTRGSATKSREYVLGSDLPPQIEALARRDLIPVIEHLGEEDRLYTVREEDRAGGWSRPRETPPAFQAYVLTTEGYALAGRFIRKGGESECWSIPAGANIVEWVRVALEELSARDPIRFPPKTEWAADRRWWTPDEVSAADARDVLLRELAAVTAEIERKVGQADAELDQAHSRAMQAERRLLTSQGSELVAVVADCLREFGYDVEDMDETATEGDRLEDLRVSAKEAGGWIALAEVRGYKRGAQVSDLFRIVRFGARYSQENGRSPDRMWYVVNQFVAEDPSARQRALAGNNNEVEIFQEDGGLVIESSDLFRLWMDVRKGEVNPEAARGLLSSVGRFSYP